MRVHSYTFRNYDQPHAIKYACCIDCERCFLFQPFSVAVASLVVVFFFFSCVKKYYKLSTACACAQIIWKIMTCAQLTRAQFGQVEHSDYYGTVHFAIIMAFNEYVSFLSHIFFSRLCVIICIILLRTKAEHSAQYTHFPCLWSSAFIGCVCIHLFMLIPYSILLLLLLLLACSLSVRLVHRKPFYSSSMSIYSWSGYIIIIQCAINTKSIFQTNTNKWTTFTHAHTQFKWIHLSLAPKWTETNVLRDFRQWY